MKKLISLITLVCMLTLSIASAIPVMTFAAESTVLLSDNFESGAISSSWLKTGGISLFPYGGEHGNVMQYTSAWDRVGYNFASAVTGGKLKISFDVNAYTFPRKSATDVTPMWICVTNSALNSDVSPETGGIKAPLLRISWSGEKFYLSPTQAVADSGAGTDAWYEPVATNSIEISDDQWVRVDLIFDVTEGKVDYYFDGKYYCTNNREALKTLTSVNSFFLEGRGLSNCKVLFDNIDVVSNPEAIGLENITLDETAKTIGLKYTGTLSAEQELGAENISIVKCGSDEQVEVKSVTRTDLDKLCITYGDNASLEAGREYKIVFTENIKSVFGDAIEEVYVFNTNNNVTSKGMSESFDTTESGTLPTTFTENASWTGSTIEYPDNTSETDKKLKISRNAVDGGTHIYLQHNISVENNKKGRLTIAFDYEIDNSSTAKDVRITDNSDYSLVYINANGIKINTRDSAFLSAWDFTKSHRIEMVLDYVNQMYELYLDGALLGTRAFSAIEKHNTAGAYGYTGNTTRIDYITYIVKGGSDAQYYDNFSVKYEETEPTVKSVRYVDENDKEQLGDTLSEGTKQINVKFNTPMKEVSATINNEAVTTGVLSEDGFTYTIPYTLGKRANILSVSGTTVTDKTISNPVTYKFAVGTTAIDSVAKADTVSVASGTALKDANLPATVVGTDENGNTVDVPVVWNADGYWKYTQGTYTLTGTLTAPMGYVLSEGLVASIDVTVGADTTAESIVEAEVLMSESAQTPLNTGALSNTDTLQMGIEAGAVTVTSDEFSNVESIADAEGGEKGGNVAVTNGDGEIEIAFTDSYNGGKALSDIRLVFEDLKDDAGAAGWNLELLYKNGSGEWIKFYKSEKEYSSRTFNTYPAIIIRGLEDKLTDVNGLKIRLLGKENGYKLLEADINMADDGSVIEAVRDVYTTPIRFAKMLSNNAVIQRDKPITVWGWGGMNGDEITVSIKNGENVVKTAKAVSNGEKWETTLEAMEGSLTEYTITAECGENKTEITGVMFGDVFIASGQSNMAYAMGNVYNRLTNIGTPEALAYRDETVAMADEDLPGLRFYNQGGGEKLSALEPFEDDYLGQWFTNGSYHGGVYNASSVAYFFAYDLYKQLGGTIPVAFIEAARGGTSVRAWMDKETFTSLGIAELTGDNIVSHNSGVVNTGCWNAMVAPFTKHAFKGVIWYQGEGDHAQYANYDKWFEAMHKSWQKAFGDENLTFTTVQIADWDGGASSAYYPEFRQTQLQIWQRNEGMVNMISAVDLGENDNDLKVSDDIHPLYKTPVGTRLSAAVLAKVYNKDVEYSGPLFDKAVKTADGIEISFTHADGLAAKTRSSQYKEEYAANDSVNNIETSADGIEWTPATAVVADGKVKVTCDSTHKFVRYAWNDWNTNLNLYNSSNYPAVPFTASTEMSKVSISEDADGIKVSVPVADRMKISGKLIAAKYDKATDALIKAEIADASFLLNDADVEYKFNMQCEDGEYIKVMMVSSMEGLCPLTKFGTMGK
ncbi:MAG: sialate O-acetylesterase [Clostridia bacterium]|nr:sialate O-acetylesterase [Clostridia bacterium]